MGEEKKKTLKLAWKLGGKDRDAGYGKSLGRKVTMFKYSISNSQRIKLLFEKERKIYSINPVVTVEIKKASKFKMFCSHLYS